MNPEVTIQVEVVKIVLQIIDTASQRGAFKGNELQSVGAVWGELSNSLKQAQQSVEQKSE